MVWEHLSMLRDYHWWSAGAVSGTKREGALSGYPYDCCWDLCADAWHWRHNGADAFDYGWRTCQWRLHDADYYHGGWRFVLICWGSATAQNGGI